MELPHGAQFCPTLLEGVDIRSIGSVRNLIQAPFGGASDDIGSAIAEGRPVGADASAFAWEAKRPWADHDPRDGLVRRPAYIGQHVPSATTTQGDPQPRHGLLRHERRTV